MTVRDSIRTFFTGTKASVIGLPPGDQPDRPLEKTWDDYTLLSTYGDDAWPYICATKVAEQGSLPPLRLGTEDKDGEFKPVGATDAIQQLFDRPNPLNTGGEFRQLMLLYMEMVGHAPIEVVRPAKGARLRGSNRQGWELYVHNPSPWRIVANPDATIKGYMYLLANTPHQNISVSAASPQDIKWWPEDMTYLRWPNPLNRWYGQGRIAATRQAVMAEEYASIRDKKFEQQMGVPPGILTSEMPLGQPQADELQRRWEKAVGGYQNAGKIAILGSKTTYQSISMSRTDAQWLETRHWRVAEIAGAFEVPLVLVLMSEATYANAKEARAEWWEGSLSVKLARIEEMVTERLIPLITDRPLIAKFDLTKVAALNENEKEVAAIAESMVRTASFTKGEIRKRLGHPPFGDERDDEIALPTQFRDTLAAASWDQSQPSGDTDTSEPAADVTPPTEDTPAEKPTGEPKPAKKPVPAGHEASVPHKSSGPRALKGRDPKVREDLLTPTRDAYKAQLSTFFRAQRGALLGETKAMPADSEGLIARAIDILTAKRFRERLQRISEPAIKTAFGLGASDAADTLGVKVSFAIDANQEALAAVNARLVGLSEALQSTTVEDVTRVIKDGLAAGADNATIRAGLSDLFDGYQDWRLDRISRTETTNAYNIGSIGQYKDAGVSQVQVSDGDGDEPCAEANDAIWSMDEAAMNPSSHPNCTRSFDPILPTYTGYETDAAPVPERTKMDDLVEAFLKPSGTRFEYDSEGRISRLVDE